MSDSDRTSHTSRPEARPVPPTFGQRFPKQLRLRKQAEFDRVFRQRVYARNDVLKILVVANELPYSRLGLSVSRQMGTAVVRNRWKRMIREAFRLSRESLPSGLDIVVIPQTGAFPPTLHELMAMLQRLVNKARGHLKAKRGPAPEENAARRRQGRKTR